MDQNSPAAAKVALFRSLFRGREDVYARRFESRRTGKSGYAPACANEWVRGICEKPRIKCAVCPHRRFLAVTDDVVRWHLQGRDDSGQTFVAGVYPLLLDETCFFLAADFDKAGWQADAVAFLQACRRLDGPQHLGDPVAYRRDRRKDRLLQENGYFVLRFLAEDIGKDLDAVLDAILRALSRSRGSTSTPVAISRRA